MILACTLLASGLTRAGEQTFVLRDYMNKTWSNQLVTFDFTAPAGACHPASVRIEDASGTAITAQLHDIETWTDSETVRKGHVSFITNVKPLETRRFTLHYDSVAPSVPPAAWTNGDLSVTCASDGTYVDLQTGALRVRLPLGEQIFTEPVSSDAVPGPILQLERPDGTRVASSRMYGSRKVTAFRAKLTDAGPIFGSVSLHYAYADGTTMDLTSRLTVGDCRLLCDMTVLPVDMEEVAKLRRNIGDPRASVPHDGWQLTLDDALQDLQFVAKPEFGQVLWGEHKYSGSKWIDNPVDVSVANEPPGRLMYLHPWMDWWDQRTRRDITLKTPTNGVVLRAEALEPGMWVEPAPPGTWISHANLRMQQKWVPLVRDDKGCAYFQFNLASGERRFTLGGPGRPVGQKLNKLKNYILDWEEGAGEYPHLYLDAAQLAEARRIAPDKAVLSHLMLQAGNIPDKPHSSDVAAVAAWLLTGDSDVAKQVKLVERLRHHLELMGGFDKMRHVFLMCGLYDAVMGSDLITPQDRETFRAGMAILAYQVADPANWSMERGYASGNLNMSIAHVLNLGMLACTLRTHPLSDQWSQSALNMIDKWLTTRVGPDGEWPESVANYAYVSASHILPFAMAARNAGFRNFVNDPRTKRLMLYLAKQYTPPDPRHTEDGKDGRVRLLPPVGRGGAGGRFGLVGLMAYATAKSDPDYSAQLQWIWQKTGCSRNIPNSSLAGWEQVAMLPTKPDQQIPDWEFDVFGRTGVIMRHGLGTPEEWYLYLMCEQAFAYPTESAAIAIWFARGVPLVSRFAGGYAEREELFLNRVLPARPRGDNAYRKNHFMHQGPRRLTATTGLPRQQYTRIEQTLLKPKRVDNDSSAYNKMRPLPEWPAVEKPASLPMTSIRQVLFVRDTEPADANYVVMRDTVTTDQPTMWQLWTVSDKIGTPEQLADREAFLSDAPRMAPAPTRQLPPGNRYTAAGQFGVDLEFFVAAPTNTPRHVIHWSRKYGYGPILHYSEYMEMLHLQRADAGPYFVAMFPRKPDEPTPDFAASDDGHVMHVVGPFGSDYVFLSADSMSSQYARARFEGTAAAVQDRHGTVMLTLSAPGEVHYGELGLVADRAAELCVQEKHAIIRLAADPGEGCDVLLQLDGKWRLADADDGSTFGQKQGAAGWVLHFDPGCTQARLTRK